VRDGAGASLLPCILGVGDPELVRLLDPPPELVEDVHLLHERGRRTRPVWIVEDALGRLLGRPAASTSASTDVPGVMRRSGRSPAGSAGCSETATLRPAASSRAMAASAVPAGMPHMGMSGASFWRRRVSWMPSRRDTVAASSPSTSQNSPTR